MNRLTRVISAPHVNVALFVVAALLLAFSAVGGTRAALEYFSDTYTARISMSQIGVSLLENGETVAWRNYEGDDEWNETPGEVGPLLANMLEEDAAVQPGRAYPEAIAVQNTGEIGQYVRVELLRYWEDANGNKVRTVSPALINLALAEGTDWVVDENSSTQERMVLYYSRMLEAGETTEALSESLTIDPAVATKVTQTTEKRTEGDKEYTTITTVYDYDGLRFCLEASVDAVQEHNASAAILSAWGKNVVVEDGVLTLEGEVS